MQNHFERSLDILENLQIYEILRLGHQNRIRDKITDVFTLTTNILSNHLMDYQKKIDRFVRLSGLD